MEKKIASFGAMRPPKDAEAVEQVKALRKEAWEMVKDIQRCFYAPSRQVTGRPAPDRPGPARPARAAQSL